MSDELFSNEMANQIYSAERNTYARIHMLFSLQWQDILDTKF